MGNKHKNPTISFRITDAEQKQIEARILASGMMKKDYFVRSCIYNRDLHSFPTRRSSDLTLSVSEFAWHITGNARSAFRHQFRHN